MWPFLKSLWLSHENNPEVLLKHAVLSDLIRLEAARFTVSRFCAAKSALHIWLRIKPSAGTDWRTERTLYTLFTSSKQTVSCCCRVFTRWKHRAGRGVGGGGRRLGLWQGNGVHVNRDAAVTWLVLQSLAGNSNLSCISQSVTLLLLIRHLMGLHRGVRVCSRPICSVVGRWLKKTALNICLLPVCAQPETKPLCHSLSVSF